MEKELLEFDDFRQVREWMHIAIKNKQRIAPYELSDAILSEQRAFH